MAVIIALVALLIAWLQMPDGVEGQGYYEYLFWGAGHTLQFAYTQLLLLAWLLLALYSGVTIPAQSRWVVWLLLLGVAPVLLTPLIYLLYDTVSIESRTRIHSHDAVRWRHCALFRSGFLFCWVC